MQTYSTISPIRPDHLLNQLPEAVYQCLRDDSWTMLYANHGMERLTGYPARMFLDRRMNYADLIHAGDRSQVDAAIDRALEQDTWFEIMYRIVHADGQTRWVLEKGRQAGPANDTGDPPILAGIISDITDQKKQIEQQLKISENRYQTLYDNVPIGLYRASVQGFFLSVNPVMHRMFGYDSIHEFLEIPLPDLYVDPSQRSVLMAGLRENGYLHNYELYLRRRNGEHFWGLLSVNGLINDQGEMEYYDGFIKDITDRKRMEFQLIENEERYRILTENISDGVALIENQHICFVNSAFKEIFRYPQDASLEGMEAARLVIEPYRKDFRSILDELVDGFSGREQFQIQCRTHDGQTIWVEASTTVISRHGKPMILATIRDITRQKQKEQEMKQEREFLRQENIRLRSTVKDRYRLGDLIGKSEAMQAVYDLILQTAANDANVIIYGESGTGKELTARAIHNLSDRSEHAFVAVNCGAIPENLIESEFFGYKKGAFSGAVADKLGYLDIADGGTLFLDEIGDIPLNMQVKLLRVIEDGGMTPLGGTQSTYPDIRIIAATNRDLKTDVRKGSMREDFFYRLHIIPIELPPLRDRKGDIGLLTEHFTRIFSDQMDNPPEITPSVLERLNRHDWPGNVRELKNVIQRFLALGKIELPEIFPAEKSEVQLFIKDSNEIHKLPDMVRQFEQHCIQKALEKTKWHRGKAACLLGIDRKTLHRKLSRQ